MSTSQILYVKDMNSSDSDEANMDSTWDDRKLTDAYDKALKIANAEVAKRVAMSTNTQSTSKEEKPKNSKSKSSSRSSASKKKETEWKAGMPCRSVYEGDGMEYEAFVLRIINDKECIVRYLGYENSEIVQTNTLKPTYGNEERTRQIEQALHEKADDGFGSQSPNHEMETSDRVPSPDTISIDTNTYQKKKRQSKKKKSSKNNFELPAMPMALPNMSMLRNLGSLEMPMPPPPMAFTSNSKSDSEEQAISSMLLSWYMSGYYTGLYQGLKRAKEDRREN